MVTGENYSRVDPLRRAFPGGGLSNPLERRRFPEGNDP